MLFFANPSQPALLLRLFSPMGGAAVRREKYRILSLSKDVDSIWPKLNFSGGIKMLSLLRQSVRVATACVLALVLATPQSLVAQTHVVSPGELQNAIVAATQARRRNVETIRDFLSSPAAEKAMQSVHMDPTQVRQAISNLSDQELAQLASRASKAQADFAAGDLSQRDLTIILIAIAALILIIVAVR